jgi:DNA-binding NtrC family response regulator
VDTRLVAATNRSLPGEAADGRFRRDLLYRLDVIRISVPSLRDRIEDIPQLALDFWNRSTSRTGSRATLAPTTLAALAQYNWPGNVRELQNAMAALAVSAPRRGSVGPDRLPAAIGRSTEIVASATLDQARLAFEQRFVRATLARTGGRRSRAASELGLSRQGFSKLLRRLQIEA